MYLINLKLIILDNVHTKPIPQKAEKYTRGNDKYTLEYISKHVPKRKKLPIELVRLNKANTKQAINTLLFEKSILLILVLFLHKWPHIKKIRAIKQTSAFHGRIILK